MAAMRAACYARFSSDLQRATSIEDQISTARRYAAEQGWQFDESHTFTDAAVSGASLDRPGIQALRSVAAGRPLPFDVLLVDDSSRVSRDIADAIRLLQELKFAGVRVIYISQHIDSALESAETLVAVHGVVDSLYLRELGQLDRGFATGGITYGYRTVPVLDPSGKLDPHGHPLLLGKRVEILPDEARVVVQMFEWSAAGLGTARIVERLNRDGVPAPRGNPRWKDGAVKRVLVNEKYTGLLIFGKKTFERRPGTHQQVARPVARDGWKVHERPELRIVSPDLWRRVVERRQEIRAALPACKGLMRGRPGALFSRHLFSGFLHCAVCGGAMVTTTGGHGSPRYGCRQAWRNAACSNRLTIRAKVADAYLLAGLKRELTDPATVKFAADTLSAELNRLIDDRPRLQQAAIAARDEVVRRLQRLIAAIEQGVDPATVSAAIAARQAELDRLNADVDRLDGPLRQRLAVIPVWVERQLLDLAGLLSEAPESTKPEFRRLGLRISLEPVSEDARPFYRAHGEAALPCFAEPLDLSSAPMDRSCPRGAR
jgi:site-specific DNA recombinase